MKTEYEIRILEINKLDEFAISAYIQTNGEFGSLFHDCGGGTKKYESNNDGTHKIHYSCKCAKNSFSETKECDLYKNGICECEY